MNRNMKLLILIIAVVVCLPIGILETEPATQEWETFWQLRAYLVSYAGYVTMMLMSMTAILSVRHWPLERLLKGLDQQYRLHKYLGISAVLSASVHWFFFLSDDIVMELGLIVLKEERYPFWKLIPLLGEPAQLIGEWGFYIAMGLVIIAWFKYFSYQTFQKTHQVFPYLYLILVVHMLVFFKASLWLTFPGIILIMITALASTGCLLTILGRNGSARRCLAKIKGVQPILSGVTVKLQPANHGAKQMMQSYKAGQFAFARFDQDERPHPFSIAAKHVSDGGIDFLIKESGDYTSTLAQTLKPNQQVALEGPYGCFDFKDRFPHQLWVAGGIGIAPFLSGLEYVPINKNVDLVYTFRESDQLILDTLERLSRAPNISLHQIDTRKMPRLRPEQLHSYVEDLSSTSVWYCGPNQLGEALEKVFHNGGLPRKAFHRELFEFR